jgi:pimeloyl-ACP methyl ester carboxylesterase
MAQLNLILQRQNSIIKICQQGNRNLLEVEMSNKKYWSRFFLIVLLSLAATFIWSQAENKTGIDIAGTWHGVLEIQGMKLPLLFTIAQDTAGSLTALMDSPDRGAKDIPCSAVSWKNKTVQIELKSAGLIYSGEMQEDGNSIVGTFTQRGLTVPLSLHRAKEGEVAASAPKRPQEPKKPYPYLEEEVTVVNKKAGVTLAGTLTLPPSGAPFPAVVLITGSGQQDRDETVFAHKPFLVLADHLTRNGIAVLRLDDRGVGKSGGSESLAKVTTKDFADDIEAGLEFLRSRKEIAASKIGLIGHSEGGAIAPIIAAHDKRVAFIVLLAGPGVSGEETILLQTDRINQLSGLAPDDIANNNELEKKLLRAICRKKNDEKALARLRQIYNAARVEQNKKGKTKLPPLGEEMEGQFKMMVSPWYRYFLALEPGVYLKKVSCPVLALNGSKDCQVLAKENLPGIEKALRAGGNHNFTIKELPNLNHLFQTAQTGLFNEYGQIEETMAPQVLELIADWILLQVK